ncbi:MAG: haloacid dehalogenase-like hydrolase [Burkholderiaceae bacterium]|nr:haloacid dehalogenase-like hydrolase [Burkholderiaceae bacterium]
MKNEQGWLLPLTRRRWLAAAGAALALAACAPMTGAPSGADPLPSWNEGANKQRIVDFVKAVTTEGGKDYVAPGDRIAVFDNDGTLWLEYPMYTQVLFVFDRIRQLAPQHPEWKTKEPYKSLLAGDMKGVMASGEKGLFEMVLVAQSGTTTEEFAELSRQWIAAARDPRFKRPYTELTYQPMQEVLAYLRANDFKTFIVSGGSVEFMRGFTQETYGIPYEQVIGTRQKLAFEVKDGKPMVMMLPQLESNDDKQGKPINIAAIIGQRPIAAFGNSDGDFQMLQWTTAGSGARLGMLVHHDDAAREYAYDRNSAVGKLADGLDQYQAMGWGLISMKNDWKLIFAPAK